MTHRPGSIVSLLTVEIDERDRVFRLDFSLLSPLMQQFRDEMQLIQDQFGAQCLSDQSLADRISYLFTNASTAIQAAVQIQETIKIVVSGSAITLKCAVVTGQLESTSAINYLGQFERAIFIRSFAFGGQILCCLATHEIARLHLPDDTGFMDLGTISSNTDVRRERVFQVVHPGIRREFPPISTQDRVHHNLPARTDFFIGRHNEIRQVLAAIEESRHVSIVGPGGVGKTALAVRVAIEAIEQFSDGVTFVDLSPIEKNSSIEMAIATTIGLQAMSFRSIEQSVHDYLQKSSMLLILDNCEHLSSQVETFVSAVLSKALNLEILTTSRQRLELKMQRCIEVQGLELPDSDWIDPDTIEVYDAIALFIDRARQANSNFKVSADNVEKVIQVCRILDGLPLALELAASRLDQSTLSQLHNGLTQRLKVLDSRSKDLVARHRNMDSTVDWSVDLLGSELQRLFYRLCIFQGRFPIEAACFIGGPSVSPDSIVQQLKSLCDWCLIQRFQEEGEQGLYRILRPIRDCGERRLKESNDFKPTIDRLFEYLEHLANKSDSIFFNIPEKSWLRLIDEQGADVWWLLHWMADSSKEDADHATVLLYSMFDCAIKRGYSGQMVNAARALLPKLTQAEPLSRLRALNTLGAFLQLSGDHLEAVQAFEQAVVIARQLNDPAKLMRVLVNKALSTVKLSQAQGLEEIDEAIRIASELDNPSHLGQLVTRRAGIYIDLGQLSTARQDLDQVRLIANGQLDSFDELNYDGLNAYLMVHEGHFGRAFDLAGSVLRRAVANQDLSNISASCRTLTLLTYRIQQYRDAMFLLAGLNQLNQSIGISPESQPPIWKQITADLAGLVAVEDRQDAHSWAKRISWKDLADRALGSTERQRD
jgi:predicted ATPase